MTVISRSNDLLENRLLAALSTDEYELLRPRLEQVSFSLGEVVYEFGGHLDYVYFPTDQSCLCSAPWKTAPAPKWC